MSLRYTPHNPYRHFYGVRPLSFYVGQLTSVLHVQVFVLSDVVLVLLTVESIHIVT